MAIKNQISDQSLTTTSSPSFDLLTLNNLVSTPETIHLNNTLPTVTLTAASSDFQIIVYDQPSSGGQVTLPDATTLSVGRRFLFTLSNENTPGFQSTTITTPGFTYFATVPPIEGIVCSVSFTVLNNSSSEGLWDVEWYTPGSNDIIGGGGYPLQVSLGGTGLTSISANQLLYGAGTGLIGQLSTGNNRVLVTNGSGVPILSTTLPTGLAMQTPASITLTNGTGLPIGGITGLGTGVAAALAIATNNANSGGLATTVYNTYTPAVAFGGASVGITYSGTPFGNYLIVGKLCIVNIGINMTNKGSSTGNATITLPVAAGAISNTQNVPINLVQQLTYTGSMIGGSIASSGSVVTLYQSTTASNLAILTDVNFANNTNIYCTFCYMTA